MSRGATNTAIGGSWAKIDPPLAPWISNVILDMGFRNMTPVQAGTIPRALKNQDCVVEAVTGSGKTMAFVVPVLERLVRSEKQYKKGEVFSIVIAPTRELATQIHEIFNHFLSSLTPPPPPQAEAPPVASSSRSPSPEPETVAEAPYPMPCLITSGTPHPYETFLSQKSSILIGTPGRLASFLLSPRGQSVVRVNDLDVLVLDEADKLLSSPDHRRDVERIMRHLPKQRRTHLFSATMTDAVEQLVGLGLRNPVRIVVNLREKRTGEEAKERRTPTSLQNTFLICRHAEKTLQLVRLLQSESSKHEAAKFIVYFSTCAAVDYFYRILSHLPALSHFALTSFHGDLPPRVRETALNNFTSHPSSHLSPAVLLCTDVASRGVDFADVDVVIQYDPPTDPKTFSHRAGRTARAGRRGKAVILLGRGREEDYIEFLNVRKMPLVKQSYLDADLEEAEMPGEIDPSAVELQESIRRHVLTDRDLSDRGAKAFVSSMRAYTKHEASYIFRLVDLDFHSLAIAYGLLRLPAMPEIKDWRKRREAAAAKREKLILAQGETAVEEPPEDLPWQEAELDWETYAYATEAREKARQEALTAKAAARASVDGVDTDANELRKKRKIRAEMREAWSEQKDKKQRKEDRKEKRDRHKQAEWEAKLAAGGDQDIGMVERFKAAKAEAAAKQQQREAAAKSVDHVARAEEDKDYRSLKKEVQEEKAARKRDKSHVATGVVSGGMFDGLD